MTCSWEISSNYFLWKKNDIIIKYFILYTLILWIFLQRFVTLIGIFSRCFKNWLFFSNFRNLNRQIKRKIYQVSTTQEMILNTEVFEYTMTVDLNIARTQATFLQMYYHGLSVNTNDYQLGMELPRNLSGKNEWTVARIRIHTYVSWWSLILDNQWLEQSYNQAITSNY